MKIIHEKRKQYKQACKRTRRKKNRKHGRTKTKK